MRTIRTGHSVLHTDMSPMAIAMSRVDGWREYNVLARQYTNDDAHLFLRKFDDYRGVARRLALLPTAPLEIETLGFIARLDGSVQEAALIEALASLRAEGVRL